MFLKLTGLTRKYTLRFTHSYGARPYSEIPGPWSLPGIGCLFHFLTGGSLVNKKGYDLADHLYKTYGPIVKLEGFLNNPTFIFLFDPEAISIGYDGMSIVRERLVDRNIGNQAESCRYLFRCCHSCGALIQFRAQVHWGERQHPIRPGFQSYEYYRKVHSKNKEDAFSLAYRGNTGLVTEHGDKWKQFRSIVNPILMHQKTAQMYYSAIDEVSHDFVQRIRELRKTPSYLRDHFDLELEKWALEAIGVVALGGRIGCFSVDLPTDSPVYRLIKNAHEIHKIADVLEFKPGLWRVFTTPEFKRAMMVYEEQIRLSRFFIKKAIEGIQKRDNQCKIEKGVLEKLLDIDENVALIMAADMLFAGVDTAANTLSATLYLLAANPEKQDKLREEIFSGSDKMPYLNACIKESLRVMPVVSGNLRLTTKEYVLCGYVVPENKRIALQHEYISRMESQHIQPNDFIPERWLVDKSDPLHFSNAHKFATSPFGFGTRHCIGKRIALLEFETALKRILSNFKIEWHGPPVNRRTTSMSFVVGPFNYVFKDL